MRVLGRIRLSRLSEESTSSGRQRELIEQWSEANGHTVVGWAEDLDVSGSVDPFQTPELGRWLSVDHYRFDVLVAWKLDRLGRDSIRLNKLFGWCVDNGKTLVSTSEGIDLSTPVGRLIANVIAFLAEGELEAIRERTKASRRRLLEEGRWPGGRPPYGLQPVPLAGGGWKLGVHPEQSKIVQRIAAEVIDGSAIDAIASRLNDEGIPAPRGGVWHGTTLRRLIRAKYLIGHATYGGETVRDLEGLPVLWGDPVLSREVWNDLQRSIEEREALSVPARTREASPLLGVAVCYECDQRLFHRVYRKSKRKYAYYYCREKHGNQIPADQVEELAEETFLKAVGDARVQEKVFIPAENHQIELEEAVRAVDELTALAGTMTSTTLRKRLTDQLSALDLRITELEQLPTSEARWEYRETTETYNESWKSADTEGRRQLLLRSGITAAVLLKGKTRTSGGSLHFELRIPEDVRQRLSV